MRHAEFQVRTGWTSTKAMRAVRDGYFIGKDRHGSGFQQDYTERDVLMAHAIDHIRTMLTGKYADTLIRCVAAAVYGEEDPTSILVIHPPIARFVDNVQQAAQLVDVTGDSLYVLKLPEQKDPTT